MNRVLLVVIAFWFMLSCSGCAAMEAVDNEIKNQQEAIDTSKKIIKYINENDMESFKKLFSTYDQEQEDFEYDVRKLFDRIDGEIVSFDIDYRGDSSLSVRDGKITEQLVEVEINNISTDTWREYTIIYGEYKIYVDDETKVGIVWLRLKDYRGEVLVRVG